MEGGIRMEYRTFRDGIRLSRLGMGVMRLPVLEQDNARIDEEKAMKLIECCMDAGVNYYDTAYIYHGGRSEEFLGRALAKYPRDTYYVADKYNFQAEADYRKQFGEQLDRLQMDRIDFYLLHGIQDHFVDEMLANGCIAYFDAKKKEGRIRYLGFSFHGSAQTLHRLLKLYPWDFVQIQLNYYDWYCGDAKELYEILREADIPVMVMEPVHGGLLAAPAKEAAEELQALDTDVSLASWAMRWVKSLDQVQVVLSGMSAREQIEDNIHTFSGEAALTKEEQEAIERAARAQFDSISVACTGCRYCCPNCPQELDIPFLLEQYNKAKMGGAWRIRALKDMPQEKQPASCIGCGACTEHCPQEFAVFEYMRELQEMLEKL